jgi:hypothetical protein
VAAGSIGMRRVSAALSAFKVDRLERRGDLELVRVAKSLVSCAVIFRVVALH